MRSLGNKSSVQESGKSCYSNTLSKLISSPKFKKGSKVTHVKKVKPKSAMTIASSLSKRRNTNSSSKGAKKNDTSKKLTSRKGLLKAHDTDPSDKLSSLKLQNEKSSQDGSNEKRENADGETKTRKRRRKKTSKKNKVDVDETARLQRRTRYLLIKIKLEQNLIDAYSGEGWKGQSREKIKPEKELQRAENQILKCKLGIRDAIRQLHSLSSVGSIADSVIDPDGSVYHEHIFCAKCKLNEAFADNDIVLCDGTCNAAFHQQCLDPPLSTENILRGDQGWFCKFCECKLEILEVVNAHLGTCFSMDSTWQDVFKEEASFHDGGNLLLNPDEEWPSDESDDDDYNPDRNLNSCSISREGSDDNGSDDGLSTDSRKGSHESTDKDIVSGRRQRSSVDYKKLYDEMFGKDGPVVEQVSDDEDWGPRKKKRREKESDAATTLMTLYESERIPDDVPAEVKKKPSSDMKVRRSCFRIPHTAVEKLRQVFSENELPSKAVKDNLSKELGLDPEKVSKWFKNTRYLALKTRKAEGTTNIQTSTSAINKESRYENVTGKSGDLMVSDSEDTSAKTVVHSPRHKKLFRRKHRKSLSSPLNKIQPKGSSCLSPAKSNKDGIELSDDVSLKKLLKGRTKEKRASIITGGGDESRVAELEMEGLSKVNDNRGNINAGDAGESQVAEVEVEVDRLCTVNNKEASIIDGGGSKSRVAELEMERLCAFKGRLEHIRQRLLTFQVAKAKKSKKSQFEEESVIYVPVAVLKEKV